MPVAPWASSFRALKLTASTSTGFRRNLNPKARFYEEDIRNTTGIRKIFLREKPEIVCHQAAIAEVMKSLRDPLPTLDVNVQGTVNLLVAAGEIRVRKFLFASTGGAIYGGGIFQNSIQGYYNGGTIRVLGSQFPLLASIAASPPPGIMAQPRFKLGLAFQARMAAVTSMVYVPTAFGTNVASAVASVSAPIFNSISFSRRASS